MRYLKIIGSQNSCYMKHFLLFNLLICLSGISVTAQDIWTIYNEQNSSLPNNTVRVLAVDQLNRKWVGTDFGLAVFNDTIWTVYNTQNSALTDNLIRALYIDQQNTVWVGTLSGGLYEFDGTNWTNFTPVNSGIPDYCVRSVAVDSVGRKWIGTVEGLAMYNDTTWKVWTTLNSDLFSNNISCIKVGRDNRITAGTLNGGIAVTYDTTLTVYNRNNGSGIPDNTSLQIALDSADHYWFASPAAGVYVDWGNLNWQMFNNNNSGMPVSASTCIFIDEKDRQYIGTEQNGLIKRVMPDSWSYFTTENSDLPENWIHAIIKDNNGLLWIGTHNGGLVSLQEDISNNEKLENSIAELKVYPNPAADHLFFELAVENPEKITIFDLIGKQYEVSIIQFGNLIQLNLSGLNKGTYIIEMKGQKLIQKALFVKS